MEPVFEVNEIVVVVADRPNGVSKDIRTKGQIGIVIRIDEDPDNPDPNQIFYYEVLTESDSIHGFVYFANQLRLATESEIKAKLVRVLKGGR